VFDGVVVALDGKGLPSDAVLAADLESGGAHAVLYLVDILYAEEWDLRRLPLRERKAALGALLPESGRLQAVDPVAEQGEALARAARESGLPGIIGKLLRGPLHRAVSENFGIHGPARLRAPEEGLYLRADRGPALRRAPG
jgi:bifunctional non-homologous end joining protein LigD